MSAYAAAVIMVNHNAGTDLCFPFGNLVAHVDNNAAGFMTGDKMFRPRKFAPVGMQIRAAHAGGLDLYDDVARPWRWVRKFS